MEIYDTSKAIKKILHSTHGGDISSIIVESDLEQRLGYRADLNVRYKDESREPLLIKNVQYAFLAARNLQLMLNNEVSVLRANIN